jgi:hypothetical protein
VATNQVKEKVKKKEKNALIADKRFKNNKLSTKTALKNLKTKKNLFTTKCREMIIQIENQK